MSSDLAVPRVSKAGRFEALDALRGVAAISVCLFHVQWVNIFDSLGIISNAWLFVDLFFVLSGFVIAYTYAEKISANPSDVGRFLFKRLARIYPLHIVMLLAFVALEVAKWAAYRYAGVRGDVVPFSINNLETFTTNILLIHSLHTYDVLTWNVPSWSISVEFAIYIVFAIVAAVAAGRAKALTLLSAMAIVLSVSVLMYFAPGRGLHVDVDFGVFRCLLGFFIGVLTYLGWRAMQGRASWSGWKANLLQLSALTACALTISLFGKVAAWQYAVPLFSALAIWSLAVWTNTRTARFLTIPPLRWLGRLSFALYMGHYFVLVVCNNLLRIVHLERFGPVGSLVIGTLLAVVCVCAALILAVLLNRYVEEPCVRAGARWLRRGESGRLTVVEEAAQ
ncbi:acyltransferase [Caulobacter sp. 602-1]|uniref:acyltransferase family protein n=1 Tax=Caulobacter sp. 602-1 TaxID=2492472 RepID=UPI000F63025A|nr:acyltransferase [Caulobacter sp. 602-1]RRN62197.1 acyltransferase [Caulobacter sp. 602-1]